MHTDINIPKADSILLALTRAAMWDEEPQAEGLPISEDEWSKLLIMARKQAVEGLVYDAIIRLPEDLLPPATVMKAWIADVRTLERNHMQHLHALAYIGARMEAEAHMQPIVLKGLPLASTYPHPEHRRSGDIDLFYGSRAQCSAADDIIESWGWPISRNPSHESIYNMGDVVVEHHGLLTLSHVWFRRKRLTKWIEDQLTLPESTKETIIEGLPVRTLSPELDMVQMVCHIMKHALNEGIGLRHICDLALYTARHHDVWNKSLLRQWLTRFGARRWTELCLCYCTRHLGLDTQLLPWPMKANPKTLEAFHCEMMKSGNFGLMDERNISRPTEGRASQMFTARRIARNVWRYFKLSPLESLGWAAGLTATRLAGK